jgi:hypothetical protein
MGRYCNKLSKSLQVHSDCAICERGVSPFRFTLMV